MIFEHGEAHAGELVLPVPNRRMQLADLWGICVSRPGGRVALEDAVIDPGTCAMICHIFRLPGNSLIRARRVSIIKHSKFRSRVGLLVMRANPWKPIRLERLRRARIDLPERYLEDHSKFSESHGKEDF